MIFMTGIKIGVIITVVALCFLNGYLWGEISNLKHRLSRLHRSLDILNKTVTKSAPVSAQVGFDDFVLRQNMVKRDNNCGEYATSFDDLSIHPNIFKRDTSFGKEDK